MPRKALAVQFLIARSKVIPRVPLNSPPCPIKPDRTWAEVLTGRHHPAQVDETSIRWNG